MFPSKKCQNDPGNKSLWDNHLPKLGTLAVMDRVNKVCLLWSFICMSLHNFMIFFNWLLLLARNSKHCCTRRDREIQK